MGVLRRLLRSRKFWLAVFGVIQTVLFQFVPEFPPEIWQSIDVLVGVLIAAIAIEDAAMKRSGNFH
jgi:arginine exporter protein ArgO